MVNRILIRVKVVQLLYSYFLTRSEFRIDDAPESSSRDKRYAYSAYIDMLLLLMQLSGCPVKVGERKSALEIPAKLENNKVGRALAENDVIRTVILRGTSRFDLLEPVLSGLLDKIVKSSVYADYTKKSRHDLADDVNFWVVVFESIIAKDPAVAVAMRSNENFTIVGFNAAVDKVVSTLKSYNDVRQLLAKAKKDLKISLDKAYELYLLLLKMIIELTDLQAERLENAKSKYLVTSDDLNPNMKLVENSFAEYLRNSQRFNDLLSDLKLSKVNTNPLVLDKLLDEILASEIYKEYKDKQVQDFASDADFWRDVMKNIILPSDALYEELENQSVYWIDDIDVIGTFVLKTIRRIAQSNGDDNSILPQYKDIEDEKFGPDLFKYSIENCDTYRKYVEKFINETHWDPERMAFMDLVIMIAAIAEIINYPQIPVPVSINEYVEIANNYSTTKSGAFINGVLFSVVNYLNQEGIIRK